jgi:hypothetical protein
VAMSGIYNSTRGAPAVNVGKEIDVKADLSVVNICGVPQQAQRNVTLSPWFPGFRSNCQFPFISGIPAGRRGEAQSFTLTIVPVHEERGRLDLVVQGVIESSPYKHLPLKVAPLKTGAVSIKNFEEKCNEYVESILCQPASFTKDNCKGTRTHIHITLPTKDKFVSTILEAQVGNVYAFDVVQTNDTTGERGGYRIGLIVVEED